MRHGSLRRLLAATSVLAIMGAALAACSSPEEKAQSYYARGHEFLEKKDYVKASLEFKNALQLKKNMIEAWRGLLDVEMQSENPQALVPILRNIVELDPKDVDAKLRLGRLLLAGNAADQALELANKATELEPKSPAAIAFRAAVMLKLDNAAAAKREAQEALDLDPKNADALVVLAAERVKQNDLNGALAILNKDAAAHDNDLGIQLFKLLVLEKLGHDSDTEAQLKKLTHLYPKEIRFRQAVVAFYVKHNQPEKAEEELRAISAADPSNVQAGLDVVRLLQTTKGPEAARNELLNLIKAGGGETFKYELALASFDFAQGRADDSIKELKALISGAHKRDEITAAKLQLAGIQLGRKDLSAASALVAEVLKEDERNTDAVKLRATIRLEQSQYEPAINDLRQALNDQPRSIDLMLLLALAYERSGSIDLAEKQYADAVQASNFNSTAALNYVAFLRRRGNLDHAEEILLETSRRAPNDIPVLTALADVRLARRNWSGAQQVADAMQKIKGGETVGDQILVASLNGRGQFDESMKLLESLHQTTPSAVQPIVALVNTMVRAGKPDQASAFLNSVLKENPDNADALVLLGSVQFQQKQIAAAEASFRTAIEKQPKLPGGYVALAQLYSNQQKFGDAENELRRGLKELSDSIPLHESLASVLEQENQIDAAISEYEYLLKQQPGSLIVANNLASLLSDYRTDKESLDRAYSLAGMLNKSPVSSFQDTVGWIMFLRGDKKEATKLLEEAAKALPTRAIVQYHLGMAYKADGQSGNAREQFEKALKLNPDQRLATKIKEAAAQI